MGCSHSQAMHACGFRVACSQVPLYEGAEARNSRGTLGHSLH